MFSEEKEKASEVVLPNPSDFHRAVTSSISPPKSSASQRKSPHSRSSSLSEKRDFGLEPILSPTGAASEHSPEASPDAPGDAEVEDLLQNAKLPFTEYLHIEKFLKRLNENPPEPHNYQLISAVKLRQKESLEIFITTLEIEDLKFLSLYMNSIQVGNSTDYYFKTIRTECGCFGWFQTYGNTKTWQHIRSFVKNQIAEHILRSEVPGKKKQLPEILYEVYLQIFQQHSGRFPWGKTRSEQKFINNYTLQNAAPVSQRTIK